MLVIGRLAKLYWSRHLFMARFVISVFSFLGIFRAVLRHWFEWTLQQASLIERDRLKLISKNQIR